MSNVTDAQCILLRLPDWTTPRILYWAGTVFLFEIERTNFTASTSSPPAIAWNRSLYVCSGLEEKWHTFIHASRIGCRSAFLLCEISSGKFASNSRRLDVRAFEIVYLTPFISLDHFTILIIAIIQVLTASRSRYFYVSSTGLDNRSGVLAINQFLPKGAYLALQK